MPITRKIPTPTDTVEIKTNAGMEGVCSPSTCKSGSATEIMNPITNVTVIIRNNFELFVSLTPTPSPLGIIAISAPRVKKPIPMISRAAPARNIMMVPEGMGARTTLTINIMAVMGRTEEKASLIFSFNILFTEPPAKIVILY
jgi:hypothetical protein